MKHLLSIIFFLIAAINYAQQTDYVDFKRVEAVIFFNQIDVDSTLFNSYKITFKILKPTDSVYLDAIAMRFQNVTINKKPVQYKNDGKKLIVYHDFKASKKYTLDFIFFASPKKAMYFVGWDNKAPNQIWTQGQGKYTSHWLPSIDDMNDKIEFDITYAAPKGYQAISNGKMVLKMESTSYNLWEYDMKQPMSSYLVAVVIGKYDKKTTYSKSGIPLDMYYYPEDIKKFEPTYRYTKQMFDFLEVEIGVSYPWQNYKQVPVHDFLYAGMENTSLTIFADSFVTDSIGFVDRNYVNVNAHELAHQWFGDLVTETSGTHHWLHEGFATYYALLAEKEVFGADYYNWRLYEYAQQLLDQDKAGGSTSLLDPKSSSLTFYQKGAWVLHMLREHVGDKAFKAAVKNYVLKHRFKNVDTDDFFNEVEKASGLDLKDFKEKWLISKKLPYETMEVHLSLTSRLIKGYLQVDCMNKDKCKDVFSSAFNTYIQIKAIEQLKDKIPKEAFLSDDIKVRQAIAQNLTKIPLELKTEYESLLHDDSYATIEAALYHLWVNFPEDRVSYLEKTKAIMGFSDHNVRLLWLALHIATPTYMPNEKTRIKKLLTVFSSDAYGFETRRIAFSYLFSLQACQEECQEYLKQASEHHNWRFQKFAKSLLNEK